METGQPGEEAQDLRSLLVSHAAEVTAMVNKRAQALLRFEDLDDVAQGVRAFALESAHSFAYEGQLEFTGWLGTVVRSSVANRLRYWRALKRRAPCLLRITTSDSSVNDAFPAVNPACTGSAPSQFLADSERLDIALKAVRLLLRRDQEIIRGVVEGWQLDDFGKKLDLGYVASQRARLRALDRFRQIYERLEGSG